jgi:hypothetical protein
MAKIKQIPSGMGKAPFWLKNKLSMLLLGLWACIFYQFRKVFPKIGK